MPRPIIYFARHGQTDWNAERRLQGQRDIPLNALGRIQAAQCGTILRDLFARDNLRAADLDYVSSPLGRARDTMELMRTGLGLPPNDYRIDPRLMEMSFGRWEGYTYEELQLREAQSLAAREKDKWGFVLPEGESYEQLVRPGPRLVREHRARHGGGRPRRRLPRADRASRNRAEGNRVARRHRAGLPLRVRRRRHDAAPVRAPTNENVPQTQSGRIFIQPLGRDPAWVSRKELQVNNWLRTQPALLLLRSLLLLLRLGHDIHP